MHHFSRALSSELFKYRKRKGLSPDGSSPAGLHEGLPSSRHYAGGTSQPGQPGYHHDIYMLGTPRAYHPSLHAPAVQETEYEPYEPTETFFPRPQMHPHRDLGHDAQEMPGGITVPMDDLTLTEQFLMAMGFRNATPNGGLEAGSCDDAGLDPMGGKLASHPSLPELAKALMQLSQVLPQDHPDLINLRAAFHECFEGRDACPDRVEAAVEAGPAQETPVAWGPEDAGMMTQGMFDQAMDEVAQMPPAEGMLADQGFAAMDDADPFQQGHPQDLEAMVQEAMQAQDPWEAQQQLYDEQMEQMLNPFMMPGMFGPGFGPGP